LDKIVLVCKKRDDRMDNLVKCLKYLFPECSVEVSNFRLEDCTVNGCGDDIHDIHGR
jgi:hypothetical protein